MTFQKFDLLSVHAEGLLELVDYRAMKGPSCQQNSFALVYCWKLLSDASGLKSWTQAAEELHVAFWPQDLDPGLK